MFCPDPPSGLEYLFSWLLGMLLVASPQVLALFSMASDEQNRLTQGHFLSSSFILILRPHPQPSSKLTQVQKPSSLIAT